MKANDSESNPMTNDTDGIKEFEPDEDVTLICRKIYKNDNRNKNRIIQFPFFNQDSLSPMYCKIQDLFYR